MATSNNKGLTKVIFWNCSSDMMVCVRKCLSPRPESERSGARSTPHQRYSPNAPEESYRNPNVEHIGPAAKLNVGKAGVRHQSHRCKCCDNTIILYDILLYHIMLYLIIMSNYVILDYIRLCYVIFYYIFFYAILFYSIISSSYITLSLYNVT